MQQTRNFLRVTTMESKPSITKNRRGNSQTVLPPHTHKTTYCYGCPLHHSTHHLGLIACLCSVSVSVPSDCLLRPKSWGMPHLDRAKIIHTYITYIYRHTYSHTCMHTLYRHTYSHTYMHACIHIQSYMHAYMHAYIQAYIHSHTCMHTHIHTTYIHTYIHWMFDLADQKEGQ